MPRRGSTSGILGANGNNPVDDAAAAAAGPWDDGLYQRQKEARLLRTPVHCVKLAADGKVYVCDRGNDRIQVFDGNDPNLGKPCENAGGTPGRCGVVAEQLISEHTNTTIPGTAVSMTFSSDKAQSCLYVGDNSNMTIYILNRANLHELGRLGRSGRMAGEFHWLHQVSVDSKGNSTRRSGHRQESAKVRSIWQRIVQRHRVVHGGRRGPPRDPSRPRVANPLGSRSPRHPNPSQSQWFETNRHRGVTYIPEGG